MKKEALFVFISLLLLVTFVSAAVELEESEINTEEFELQQNVPLKINGKSIILRDDGVNEAYVLVDEVDGTIIFGKFEWINGVSIMLLNIHETNVHRNLTAFVNITTYGSCGDGICHERESCCTDCGCSQNNEACLNNICVLNNSKEYLEFLEPIPDYEIIISECNADEDCAQGEKCSGITSLCYKIENIEETILSAQPVIACKTNNECDDDDKCTRETCRKGQCLYGEIEDCREQIKLLTEEAIIQEDIKSNWLFKNKGSVIIILSELLLIAFILFGWNSFLG